MRDSLENEIPHIQFKDVSFSYLGEKENLIFKCNFSIKKPGFWMVVGKNGSGKSTLLKLINGLIQPQNGIIDSNANIGIYDEIKSSMNETLESSNLIELSCDKVQDKLITVRAKEIISVQIYEKSSVAGGAKRPGFSLDID